jgi:hypothetical protein
MFRHVDAHSDVNMLLIQLKEVHAPDRCEGKWNDRWQDLHRFKNYMTGSTEMSTQQKIIAYWNKLCVAARKRYLKQLADKAQRDFSRLCIEVDAEVDKYRMHFIQQKHWGSWTFRDAKTDLQKKKRKEGLDTYITLLTENELQLLFNKLIVIWNWRDRMMDIPEIENVEATPEEEREYERINREYSEEKQQEGREALAKYRRS